MASWKPEDRIPTNQGFDGWYGIPRTFDENDVAIAERNESMSPSIGKQQAPSRT